MRLENIRKVWERQFLLVEELGCVLAGGSRYINTHVTYLS
jgi:hypothetical protein